MAGTSKRKAGNASGGTSATPAKRGRKPGKASSASSAAAATAKYKSPEKSSQSTTLSSLPHSPPKQPKSTSLSHAHSSFSSSHQQTQLDTHASQLLHSTSLFHYLSLLPHRSLLNIYALPPPRGPIVASSVLKSCALTDLARQFVLRLVACGGAFQVGNIVAGWMNGGGSFGGVKDGKTIGKDDGKDEGGRKRMRRRGNSAAVTNQKEGFLALKRMEQMGIIEPLGLVSLLDRPLEFMGDDDDVDDDMISEMATAEERDAQRERRNKLLQKDAVLTVEFKEAMTKFLNTAASTPWPVISREQIDGYNKEVGAGGKEGEKPSRNPPTRLELERYTQSCWDSVLHFLVGSDDSTNGGNHNHNNHHEATIEEPPEAMIHFLTRIGLMQEDPDYTGFNKHNAPLVITSKGYEFMLRDTNSQVWQFVLQYLNAMMSQDKTNNTDQNPASDPNDPDKANDNDQKISSEQKDNIRMEALSFLICLGNCRVGEGFHSSALGSKSARVLMKDFARFGLLYVCRVAGKTAFYPTKVAVDLLAGSDPGAMGMGMSNNTPAMGNSMAAAAMEKPSASAIQSLQHSLAAPTPSSSHLALIIQTNFQVVAYTKSKLHISTLGLFCDISSYRRLPNVIFFHLTRDSVRSAFRLGVTAEQILRFLYKNAHPMLREGDLPLVPTNVSDQILLWDQERTRVVMDEVWAHQCRDAAEFAAVGQYASDADALAWGAAHKNKLYIHFRQAEQISAFIRRWRTKSLSGR
mmetsp:Transcript_9685/g.20623  ORF Transcript_9685/g.20623 Transcript_9685/m.20623 type:complete len:747 (-) Transcript_9685:160-2400(-)